MTAPRFGPRDKDYIQKLNQMGETYDTAVTAVGDASDNATLAGQHKDAAQAAALAAGTSETNSAASATLAGQHKDAAEAAALAAGTSETNSAASATLAGQHKDTAQAAALTAGTSESNSAASATLSGQHKDAAQAAALAAGTSETNSAASATLAGQHKDTAQAAALAASTAESNSAASATLAGQHKDAAGSAALAASTAESNSASSATLAGQHKDAAGSAALAAADSHHAAESNELKAKKWAENPADTSVEPGLFSAKHHATKAGQHAAGALDSKHAAAAAAAAANSSAASASNSASSTATAELNTQAFRDAAGNSAAISVSASESAQIAQLAAEQSAAEAAQAAADAGAIASQAMVYRGGWDASTGVYPSDPGLSTGWMYKVTVAGTVSTIAYKVNDSIIFNGVDWDHIDNTESVVSVNGKTGAVTVTKADVGLGLVRNVDAYSKTEADGLLAGKLDSTATAVAANKLATARTISISGDASGSVSFDGSTNVSISVTVADGSHNHVIGNVDGLQTALDGKVGTGDTRLTNAREWTAATVDQLEAEAGAATTRRAWTAQRVRQAINAVVNAIGNATTTVKGWMSPEDKTKLDGVAAGATANATDAQLRDRATHTGAQAISTVTGLQTALDGKSATGHGHTISDVSGLGTAAGANVTASATDTTAGRLLKVGDFGLGASVPPQLPVSDLNNLLLAGCWNVSGNTPNWPFGGEGGAVQQFMHGANTYIVQIAYASTSNKILTRAKTSSTTWTPWREIYHTGNFDPATKVNTTGDESISGTKTFTTALAVTGTAKAAGRFYAGTTEPTNTTRLNYDGHLHAKAFGAGRFQMEYNPDTESLDFNFV